MKFETNTKDDLISFLESINVTETRTPGRGTALFDTTPGAIVYLYLRQGLSAGDITSGVAIACEPSKRAVISWLRNSNLNIWMFPDIQQGAGSNVYKVVADFDWPGSGMEWLGDEIAHIGKCLTAIVERGNNIDMMNRASRSTIGATLPQVTTQSRSPL